MKCEEKVLELILFFRNHYSEWEKKKWNLSRMMDFIEGKPDEIHNICIVGSPYCLMLYLLYVGDIPHTLFLFHGYYPLKAAADVLRSYGAPCLFLSYDEHMAGESSAFGELIHQVPWQQYDVNIYGQDTIPVIMCFRHNRFVLLEDGLISYISKEDLGKTCGVQVYTYETWVKKILFIGLAPIPRELENKSNIIRIEDLWKQKTSLEQNMILSIFRFDDVAMRQCIESGRDTIVFTRNYSKVGKCTKKDQVALYKEIVGKYNPDSVILKPHPNDDIDYETYFPECMILPKNLPAEIMWLCGLPIKAVVGVDINSNVFGTFRDRVRVDLFPELSEKYNIISLRKKACQRNDVID